MPLGDLAEVLHFHEGVEDRQKSRGAAAALEFGASLLGKRRDDGKSDAALDRFRKAGKKSQAVLEVRARGARGLTPEMATGAILTVKVGGETMKNS